MPLPIKPKPQAPTAAQLAVLHVAESAGLSALVTLLLAIVQYISGNGQLNVTMLLSTLGGGFLTALTMIYKSVSANPQLAQAALDTAQEALAKIEQAAPWLARDIVAMQKPAPQPILFPPQGGAASIPVPPAQQKQAQSGGGGVPPDYYTRNYNVVVPRQSIPDMSTQGYPAVNPNQSTNLTTNSYVAGQQPQQQFTNTNQVPPAMSFLQDRPQQGG